MRRKEGYLLQLIERDPIGHTPDGLSPFLQIKGLLQDSSISFADMNLKRREFYPLGGGCGGCRSSSTWGGGSINQHKPVQSGAAGENSESQGATGSEAGEGRE